MSLGIISQALGLRGVLVGRDKPVIQSALVLRRLSIKNRAKVTKQAAHRDHRVLHCSWWDSAGSAAS